MTTRPPSDGAPTAAEVVEELRLDLIAETTERAASFAQRAATAARRRDKRLLAVRLRQVRLCTAAIVETCAEIAEEPKP